jgi:urease subunit alpha
MPFELDRSTYARLYGPTTGDRIRLADTDLYLEVTEDATSYGDEVLAGFGKTLRDGMLSTSRANRASVLDLLISNVVVFDPVLGVIKTNIGIKDGRIVGVGRAGNPDVVDNVDLVLGAHTGVIPGEGLIATPGVVDSHVHLATPSVVPAALSAGTTTLVSMGYGGVFDQGVAPSRNLELMVEAFEAWPINVAFLARAVRDHSALERALESGVSGFKIHEDPGGYPSIIDAALSVADTHDVQVAMHTDSLNEAGELAETIEAIAGRTVHAYHVEGSGGGHPNTLEIVSQPHVLGSSTTPTLPFTVSTAAEQASMIMIVHRGNPGLPEDRAAADDRVRTGTIAAEQELHDLGAIPIIGSDSQGMGRVGEVGIRTWQTAHRMKQLNGPEGRNDNRRLLAYLAKITVNPARAHGIGHLVGSLEPGRLADIVLWRPDSFGVKPQLVVKGGFVAWGLVGDGNATTRSAEPQTYRAMFGGEGGAPRSLGVVFAAEAAVRSNAGRSARGARLLEAVRDCRGLTKASLVANAASPSVRVHPDGSVTIDGRLVDPRPATELPLTRLYSLA